MRLVGRSERLIDLAARAGLLLLCALMFMHGLGNHGFINGGEALFVESAREMVLSGEWAVPTLDGLPYLEKPPLFVWLLSAAIGLLGLSEAAPRAVTVAAALALVGAVLGFSRLFGIGTRGAAAAFILATSLGVYVMARVAMPEILLTALFSIACLSFLAALRTASVAWLRSAAVLLGAAALIKGPLAIALFALIVAFFYLLEPARRGTMRAFLRDRPAALLLILPLCLWLVAIEVRQPGAAYYFVVNEHVLRFLGLREPRDYYSGSVFYYVPRLFLFTFPWTGVLFFGWLSPAPAVDEDKRQVRRFLWLCAWVPFLFFSASSAKANYYILLCVPPLALLTADYVPALLRTRNRVNLVLAILLPVLLLAALWAYGVWSIQSDQTTPLLFAVDGRGTLTVAILLLLTLGIAALARAGRKRAALLCLGGLIVPVALQIDHLAARAEPTMSMRGVARYLRDAHPAAPVYLYQDFEAVASLAIYLDRTLPVIDSKSSDLYFGQRLFPEHPNFVTEERASSLEAGSLVVVADGRAAAFLSTGLGKRLEAVATIGRTRIFRVT